MPCSASTVRDGKRSSITLNKNLERAFQRAIHQGSTPTLTSSKWGSKCIEVSYFGRLCSRLFFLHFRSRPKSDTSMHFDPQFEEVRGGVEPCLMARWKALAEFLLSVIQLLFLSPTVESLKGKTCQNSQPSGCLLYTSPSPRDS